ncbi:MAG: UDP-N-acetylglucosamine 2-epimerase (non-hydrolyzing), partial [Verrucomicrobia bacterium]|nr:UDP-N-acetylglucosamine 2-epimerase (non-hydrolyzing) [Verrucomicrobiota bacterium]
TRPEAIKMAPLVHALADHPNFESSVCVTAQHREMLDQVLQIFEIHPDIDLDLMRPGQDLFDVTSGVLQGMKQVLQRVKPDALLVHGDTTTALATAIAGFYSGIAVGHVEAGLRTYDLQAPYPEEFNRQVVSRVARWHFAPTEQSRQNLFDEKVSPETIHVTGNTVIDSLFWVLKRLDGDPQRKSKIESFLNRQLSFPWQTQRFVLITGHRRENFGQGFLQICEALRSLAHSFPKVHFVYPVHLNPAVQKPVFELLQALPNVHLLPPLEYEPFLLLLKHAYFVLTDSGGIQEEAPSLGKPVLVMRDVTERPEAVEAGTVRLVGADCGRIVDSVSELLSMLESYAQMAKAHNPYGDGQACARILEALLRK